MQETQTRWALDSVALQDARTDFILSRQAALLSENTVKFYQFTAGRFVQWLEDQGVTSPDGLSTRHVRAYLAELAGQGLKDTTIADPARAVRVLVRFWHAEGYTLTACIVSSKPATCKKKRLLCSWPIRGYGTPK
jgi:site-specific recombinase XerD